MEKDHLIEDDLDLYNYSIRHAQSDLDFEGPDPRRVKMQKQVTDMQKISKSLMAKLQVNERKSAVCAQRLKDTECDGPLQEIEDSMNTKEEKFQAEIERTKQEALKLRPVPVQANAPWPVTCARMMPVCQNLCTSGQFLIKLPDR